MNVFSDTLSQQSSNGDVGAELDLLTMFSDLDKDVTELDQELAGKEEDSKIGDWGVYFPAIGKFSPDECFFKFNGCS